MNISTTKVCTQCKKEKPPKDFHKDKSRKDGRHSACKQCKAKEDKLYFQKNEKKIRAYRKKWREKTKGIKRAKTLQALYGLSLEGYDQLFTNQKGVCYLCGGINQDGRRLCVDHNHRTGEIRGLLCSNCNGKLGWYEKNKERIKSYMGDI